MGLVQNLKKTLSSWGDKILVALSSQYIKHLAKQTLKKQDNSSSTGYSPRPLTAESQDTTMETSSTDISEKTTMKETVDIVNHIREWAVDQVESKDDFDEIADRFALIEEYKEWFNLEDDLEIVSLDQIKEDEYNDFVDYMNDGMERG